VWNWKNVQPSMAYSQNVSKQMARKITVFWIEHCRLRNMKIAG
jgi:hypothetical protein